MILFFIFAKRGLKIAREASDRYSCYLALGITAVTSVQAMLNMAVVCGAIPPTGLPLPFMSAGGSSLVAYLCAVGVLEGNCKKFHAVRELERLFCIGASARLRA